MRGVSNAGEAMDVLFKTVDLGKLTFEELAGSIGQVLPNASSAGLSLQELGAAVAVMTVKGQSASEAINDVNNLIQKIKNPPAEAEAAFRELGISFGAVGLEAKGLPGILQEIMAKTRGQADAIQRLMPDMESNRALTSLLTEGGLAYAHTLQKMRGATDDMGATQKANERILEGTTAKWEKFRAKLERTAIEAGEKVLPKLNAVLEWAADHTEITMAATAVAGLAVSFNQLAQAFNLLGGTKAFQWVMARGAGPWAAGLAALAAGGLAVKTALETKGGGRNEIPSGDLNALRAEEAKKFPTGFHAQSLLRERITEAETKGYSLSPRNPERRQHLEEAERLKAELAEMKRLEAARLRGEAQGRPGGLSFGKVEVKRLTPEAQAQLQALDAALKKLGLSGTLSSGKRNNPEIKSAHNDGRAVDLTIPGQSPEVAEALRKAGFQAQFERKGQRNANGSVATGDHIHVTLVPEGPVQPEQAANAERQKRLAEQARREAERRAEWLRSFESRTGLAAMPNFTPEQRRARSLREAAVRLNEQSREFREAQGREPTLDERKKLQAAYYAEVTRIERNYREELKHAEEKRLEEDRDQVEARYRLQQEYAEAIQGFHDDLAAAGEEAAERETARIVAATEALLAHEAAEQERVAALRETNAELLKQQRLLAEMAAEAAGPEQLRSFLESRVAGLDVRIAGLREAPGDTERPETELEKQRRLKDLTALEAERLQLLKRIEEVTARIADNAEKEAAAVMEAADALREAAAATLQRRRDLEAMRARVREAELGQAIDEAHTPRERREAIENQLAEKRDRISQTERRLAAVDPNSEQGLRYRDDLVALRSDERELTKDLGDLKGGRRLKQVVPEVADSLFRLVDVFKGGENQLSQAIASLAQIVMSFMPGSDLGLFGGIVGGLGSIFGFDSPMEDSKARRWGFDFGLAFGQGAVGGERHLLAGGAVAGTVGAGPVNVTINQNNHGVGSQVDMDRNNRDLTDQLWRSLRTLKKR
ncbi:MAG: phage tail tape measure protein [Armatimonadota bacterium]